MPLPWLCDLLLLFGNLLIILISERKAVLSRDALKHPNSILDQRMNMILGRARRLNSSHSPRHLPGRTSPSPGG
jgi:hypothetical protein